MKKSGLDHFAGRVYRRIEGSSGRVMWWVLFLYVAAMAVISAFHEPWFDEAQAWLIARDASFRDILLVIPHYEGHPPLWHLYLALFAKTGMPYEFGLKLASILLNAAAMGILVFKAPFPKTVRFTIPFTYFFFYQYGVISRCYSLTILGFVLCALFWRGRNEKPFRPALAMMLVCASTAYGIVLCAGMAMVWLFEIWDRRNIGAFLRSVSRDRRLWALLLLLVSAVVMLLLIIPRADTYAMNLRERNSIWTRLFYMLILAPLDALFYTSIPGSFILFDVSFACGEILLALLVFLAFSAVILALGRGFGKLALLAVPYGIYSVFCAYFYFYSHHVGIFALYFLYWLWVCFDDPGHPFKAPRLLVRLCDAGLSRYRACVWIAPALVLVLPLYWSVSASVLDIGSAYSDSRAVATFLRDNGLADCRIMTGWDVVYEENDGAAQQNTANQATPIFNAYFDRNISFSFNAGKDSLTYCTHIVPTEAEMEAEFALWAAAGPPEVLIGRPELDIVYGGTVDYSMYSTVADIRFDKITKDYQFIIPDDISFGGMTIHVRNDLLARYGLIPLDT